MPKAHIIIAATQVPFTRGGAEILVDKLRDELKVRDFAVDVVQVPFSAKPKEKIADNIAIWRATDLSSFNDKDVDLVICTKFPSYMVSHENKVAWLVHQHRQIYDLHGSRFGDFSGKPEDEALRQLIVKSDIQAFNECKAISTISGNVTERLKTFLGLDAVTLPPPLPLGDRYYKGQKGDYVLSVGRICSIKRVDMMVKALPMIEGGLKLKVVGVPDEPAIEKYLQTEIDKHHLWARVEFLGRVGDDELLDLYANSLAVYYAPFDEDYGFVTLEGLASGKPVITATDSGGVLEFIENEKNGLISEPTEQGIADACNRLLNEEGLYDTLCEGASRIELTSWDEVISELTKTIPESKLKAA